MQATLIKTVNTRSVPSPEQFNELGAWGLYTSVDIHNCDPAIIRDADMIRQYVVQLCDLIEMKRFGETQVVHFGEDERVAGYSMIQLIETSLISGHFANSTNSAYLDIFSCKFYDTSIMVEFTKNYFKASDAVVHITLRK